MCNCHAHKKPSFGCLHVWVSSSQHHHRLLFVTYVIFFLSFKHILLFFFLNLVRIFFIFRMKLNCFSTNLCYFYYLFIIEIIVIVYTHVSKIFLKPSHIFSMIIITTIFIQTRKKCFPIPLAFDLCLWFWKYTNK